jgi:hypothetical protein
MNHCDNNGLQVKYLQGRGQVQVPAESMQVARVYNMSVQTYTTSANVLVESNCFSFMFTNLGDTIARVNGMIIYPPATPGAQLGDSRSISAHVLDLFKGNITIAFDPGGTAPLVEVVQLYYAEQYHH